MSVAKAVSVILVFGFSFLSCTIKEKDVLVVGVLNPPFSLQAWKIRDGVSTVIGGQMHRGLIRVDPTNGNFIGAVAKSWEFVKGKPWVRFYLNDSLRFHDGSVITCNIVKKSFERLIFDRQDTTVLFPKKTVFDCESDFTFIINLPFVPAQLLDVLASPSASIVKDDGLIGLGPYKLVSNTAEEIRLRRFSGGGPNELHFIISDHEKLVKKFINKQVDDLLYLGLFVNVNAPCKRIEGLSPTSFWFGINGKSWGFGNLENRIMVQQLLRLSLKKTPIFDTEIRSESLIPFGVMGNRGPTSDDLEHQITNVASKVKRLVKKFGKIRFALRNIQKDAYDWERLITAVDPKRELFVVEYLSNKDFFSEYYSKKLSVFFIGANITRNDPFEVLSFFRAKDFVNQSGISEPVVDKLMEKSFNAKTSDDVRYYAQQANDWIISQGYVVPLFSKKFIGCVQAYWSGYNISSLGPLSMDYSSVSFVNE